MTEYDRNVYYNPGASGLELVHTYDQDNLSYEYNTFIILRDVKNGNLFWARDSGCSCPTPFEDYYYNENGHNLNPITKETVDELERELKDFGHADGYPAHVQEIRLELKKKTRKKEKLVAEALDTKEGRKLLWDKGFAPAIKEWIDSEFSKWDKVRQERWMDVAFGPSWRDKLPK